MADVFDQISPDQEGDVFDKVATESPKGGADTRGFLQSAVDKLNQIGRAHV